MLAYQLQFLRLEKVVSIFPQKLHTANFLRQLQECVSAVGGKYYPSIPVEGRDCMRKNRIYLYIYIYIEFDGSLLILESAVVKQY